MKRIWDVVYSSLSSIGITGPAFAPPDDDDKIGPESFNTDEMMLPDPPTRAVPPPWPVIDSSSKSEEWSEASLSSSISAPGTGTALPPLNPPLNPPSPPAELPLSAPNFDVIAAIFGEITALRSCWRELIGAGGSMPAALFFAIFVWSSWFRNCVLASRMPSIFYKFTWWMSINCKIEKCGQKNWVLP